MFVRRRMRSPSLPKKGMVLLWIHTFGRSWQTVYERYDQATAMLAMVHRNGQMFKATVLKQARADHVVRRGGSKLFLEANITTGYRQLGMLRRMSQ